MGKMREWFKNMTTAKWIFVVGFAVAVCLLTAGFMLPPMGVIDNSVLIGVAEIMGFALIPLVPEIFGKDSHIKVEKGDAKVTLKLGNKEETEVDE